MLTEIKYCWLDLCVFSTIIDPCTFFPSSISQYYRFLWVHLFYFEHDNSTSHHTYFMSSRFLIGTVFFSLYTSHHMKDLDVPKVRSLSFQLYNNNNKKYEINKKRQQYAFVWHASLYLNKLWHNQSKIIVHSIVSQQSCRKINISVFYIWYYLFDKKNYFHAQVWCWT